MNPHNSGDNGRGWLGGEIIGLEEATVVTSPLNDSSSVPHRVEVKPFTLDEPMLADVRIAQSGDVSLPTEETRVIIGYRLNGQPVVLGGQYTEGDTLPDVAEGERIIGHSASQSHIKFAQDGSITVKGDGGNTVELSVDGAVVVNGGDTEPVTDVETTENADGYVTDVSLMRADGVYLPSQ
jgi:hypothetical protein